MSETYDNFEVRRVLMEIPSRLLDSVQEHGVEVDGRVLMALQSMCFGAIAHLDENVLAKREAEEMKEAFKSFTLTPEETPSE
jgi:hypothetical protein